VRQTTVPGDVLWGHAGEIARGLRLAEFGWLGPLALAFAWYANIPLIVCTIALARGRAPDRRAAVAGAALALTALFPFITYGEVDGWRTGLLRGPAVVWWRAAGAEVPSGTA
jgi:hypothetical protein